MLSLVNLEDANNELFIRYNHYKYVQVFAQLELVKRSKYMAINNVTFISYGTMHAKLDIYIKLFSSKTVKERYVLFILPLLSPNRASFPSFATKGIVPTILRESFEVTKTLLIQFC